VITHVQPIEGDPTLPYKCLPFYFVYSYRPIESPRRSWPGTPVQRVQASHNTISTVNHTSSARYHFILSKFRSSPIPAESWKFNLSLQHTLCAMAQTSSDPPDSSTGKYHNKCASKNLCSPSLYSQTKFHPACSICPHWRRELSKRWSSWWGLTSGPHIYGELQWTSVRFSEVQWSSIGLRG